jgi:hypothetical protein
MQQTANQPAEEKNCAAVRQWPLAKMRVTQVDSSPAKIAHFVTIQVRSPLVNLPA